MKYDIEKLKDGNTIEYFTLLLQNKYKILQDKHTEDNTVKCSWTGIKIMIKIVCEEGIGLEKWKNKRWISEKKTLKNTEKTKSP